MSLTFQPETTTSLDSMVSGLQPGSQSEQPSSLAQQIHRPSASSEAPSMRRRMLETVESPFSTETKQVILGYLGGTQLSATNIRYIDRMASERPVIVGSFVGSSAHERLEGMKTMTALRHEFAFDLFNYTLRPQIEALMRLHGDERNFDEAVCIYGFNRLFTREYASAGTDIDFMLVIDTQDAELIQEIRNFVKEAVKPKLKNVGMDMETADYLMLGLNTYTAKLDDTRKSLFTLANMFNPLKPKANVELITGSEPILRSSVFSFTDKQLAEHFGNLVAKMYPMQPEDLVQYKEGLVQKLAENGAPFRIQMIDHLQRMANSELYIGRKPYDNKKTIQTELSKADLADKIAARTAKFSIKFSLNRIADLFASTTLQSETLTPERLKRIENLALVLSNIVCWIDTPEGTPALTLQQTYSDISLDQIRKMSLTDRHIVSEILASLGQIIDPFSENFAEECYDNLWALGKSLYAEAQTLEHQIFFDARNFSLS
ncbi:MAG: hypothetical protein KF898_08395 [Parachlamydiales bacterium]|nr:hypothetical protein [Candidatus Acheromyda pituitae]